MKKQILNNLNEYINRIDKSNYEKEYEKKFENLGNLVQKKTESIDEKLASIANRLFKISDITFFYKELFVYKTYLLVKAIIFSIETSNHLSLANNVRSLLEQIAIHNYFINIIDKMLNELENKNTYSSIDKIIKKVENIINRIYYGENKDSNKFKSIHINEALKIFSNNINNIYEIYDYLCELVHPNYNNNLLISSGEISKGRIGIQQNNTKIINNIMNISNSLIVSFINETTLKTPLFVWELHNYVEICLKNTSKIENIFSKKIAIPKENGDSIETAFSFEKARTSQEALRLMYEYLRNEGYNPNNLKRQQVINEKSLEFIKQGFLIDEWTLPNGEKIYFKTKKYKGF